MIKRFLASLALSGSVVLLLTPAQGHHAFSSEFDIDKPIRLRGVITRMEWVNPHSWLHMTATLDDGSTEDWMLEGGTPNTLLRAGLTQQILLPGTEIQVRGYQSKDPDCVPKCRGSGRDITFADGSNIFMGSSGVGAPPGGFPDDNQ
ncbi:MAG: DUF6152 family protein [Proteobacteria bacterium]|nr:DUF6152 family protein [Pseudomonadota bacterium]